MGEVKKPAMNNIKRFSDHRDKDEIRQNVKAPIWKGPNSDLTLDGSIKVPMLIAEGIRYLAKRRKHE
jgi:hypothetical protein